VNPYTGCAHRCLYCYASSYIKGFFNPRPKEGFPRVVARDLRRVPEGSIINVSSSSDPYQPLELEYGYARLLLEMVAGRYVVEVVTKSDLVTRDADLLTRGPSVVSITITTLDANLASHLEPGAPAPGRRVEAVRKLSEAGVPVVVRLDPLIPGLNDSPESMREVLEAAAGAGAKHVVASTYKAKPDSLRRLTSTFPEIIPKLRELYIEGGERFHGYLYAAKSWRLKTLSEAREIAHRLGLSFAVCREGFPQLIDAGISCDGTHLARLQIKAR